MSTKKNSFKIKMAMFSLSTKQRLSLYKKISVFLSEQVPLDTILLNLAEQYGKKDKNDPRSIMMTDWYNDIEDGRRLSEAMNKWVPYGEAMLIKAGEESDNLSEAFMNALESTQASKDMKGAIMASLAYPCILFTMLFSVIYLFSTEAIPKLADTMDPETWPESTKVLYSLSMFVQEGWFLVIIGLFGLGYFLSWSLENITGPVRKVLDYFPPWSMYKSFQSSIFLISASAMLKTGIPLFEALRDLKSMSPKYIAAHMEIIMKKMEEGASNGDSLNSGFLDEETGIDISIFSQTHNIQDAMESIGRSSIKNSISRVQGISQMLNILAMFMVTGFIGWVYYSFWSLSQAMGGM